MKRVMAFGTFDLLHPGHVDFLSQAKKFGDYLIVVVSRDDNALKAKGRNPINSQAQRLELVSALKMVDKAVKGRKNPFEIINELNPEIIALGYDQKIKEKELKLQLEMIGLHPEIRRCKAFKPHKFKSSKMRKKILKGC